MELKINEIKLPAPITFNYEELKAELLQKAETYASIVYTDDQIKAAKADRANLNRLKKALNDERLNREKEYMQPFATFKAQVNEIISIIDKPCAVIDSQVKAFEEQQKANKRKEIEEFWSAQNVPEWYKQCPEKWLNASVSMKSIKDEITGMIEQTEKDIAVLNSLPSYAFESVEWYKHTRSLAEAVSEAHRLQEQAEKKAAWEAAQQKRKEEAEKPVVLKEELAEKNFDSIDPVREWIVFKALLSVSEAKALGEFLKSNAIRYKQA